MPKTPLRILRSHPVGFAGSRSHLGGAPGTNDHRCKFCIYRGACGAQGVASFGWACCFLLGKDETALISEKRVGQISLAHYLKVGQKQTIVWYV